MANVRSTPAPPPPQQYRARLWLVLLLHRHPQGPEHHRALSVVSGGGEVKGSTRNKLPLKLPSLPSFQSSPSFIVGCVPYKPRQLVRGGGWSEFGGGCATETVGAIRSSA
uniref:Uncharacterized protein n=1 Tax=Oryza rufipogon TaxID=4529 RepID=A0A0E0Q7X9_ORYRU